MRRPTDLELLDVWELGQRADPAERAMLFFGADTEDATEGAQTLTVGERDAELLDLRETLFGADIAAVANCPKCGEQVELGFRTSDVRAPLPGSEATFTIDGFGYTVTFRLPTSEDLALVAATIARDVEAARSALFSQCIVSAQRRGKARNLGKLPARLFDLIGRVMGELDPQGDVRISLSCPECDARWIAPFDIVQFLWAELDGWARRTLADVHTLAKTYGWSEAEVLAIPAWRREHYLEYGSS